MRIAIDPGNQSRRSPLVRVNTPGVSGTLPPPALQDESTGELIPTQYDAGTGELSFVVPGEIRVGEPRTLTATDQPVTPPRPASAEIKLDRAILQVAGQRFADYIVAGGRRPYFWPVVSSTGSSVVRGQGSADHPHHTGLAISYGGHSEDGSTNIWSDWDEPPYGPGGRMLHRGFRRVVTGPVYGEIAQDLTYLNSDGDTFADELRTIRWWWADNDTRYLEFFSTVRHVADRGNGPFLLMVRTPESMGIPDVGRITNSAAAPAPERVYQEHDRYRAAWVDTSGPSGGTPPPAPSGPPEDLPDLRSNAEQYRTVGDGPWHGIAVLDHPSNDGYPNIVGKYAMVQQITQAHYPPEAAPNGPFQFQQRVVVHAGDGEQAGIAAAAADYATPCAVQISH